MDREAFSNRLEVQRLLDRHARAIRKFIGRRSGPELLKRTTVDDLFQETVTAAIQNAGGFVFVDHGRFLCWVYTIARRVMARSLTNATQGPHTLRIRRANSSGVGVPEAELMVPIRTPSSMAATQEHKTALGLAIRTLPEHYRKVITLYKIEQRPLAEVAVELGRSKGATCRLIARAMDMLRKRLPDQ
jgi:RNA polymerase sigma factor (sigma-70 family)